MSQNFLKILAPAGDWACLRTAVKAGADCIYIGVENFNMRSTGAKNFPLKDLQEISKFCHENDTKIYITVNTVLYNADLSKMEQVIQKAKEFDYDGIIVSDIAAMEYAKSINMPMTISTQLSVSNIESVRFFSKYADRIVLARELTLEQIGDIVKQIEEEKIVGPKGELVEIEIFGHGAMCVAVSGRCSMSLYCYNSSANKGECTQVCRRAYKVKDLETGKELKIDNNYIMSPRDISTIGMLPEILKAGIKVLKIEGRARPPEYVDTVVRCYKEALEAVGDGNYSKKLVEEWNKRLGTVFNRGFSTGMYMGRDIKEWAEGPGNQSGVKKHFLGKVLHYFPKKKVALIRVQGEHGAKEMDPCLITGNKTGLVKLQLENMVIDNKKVSEVKQNDEFTIQVPNIVRKNDEVYILMW
jgi:U32 family peptidase